jgi:hypothetical protein
MPARGLFALVLAMAALFLWPVDGRGYTFGPNVQQIGPQQTVFDWTTQRCDDEHVPDSPARAFKDSSGRVQLTMAHAPANRRLIGPTLDTVAPDCTVTFNSHANADPSTYDDQEWITAPWTPDGSRVYSFIHMEYHGWDHIGQCTSQGQPAKPKLSTIPAEGFNPGCWYNAITLASSTDGGNSFTHTAPPSHLVASVPYTYAQSDASYGYFNPSNIIKSSDGYFYAMMQAEPHLAQQAGICVMRTRNLAIPTSWRAWDGTGYNVKLINPYVNHDPPEQHVCAPVAFNEIEKMVQSLTYNTYFKKYLLIGQTGLWDPIRQEIVYGAYYSTSSDLIHWSPRSLVMEAELTWTYQCGDADPISYPSVLNPASPDRNFSTTGQKVYLYFTVYNDTGCLLLNDRDLIRIPIKFLTPTTTGP